MKVNKECFHFSWLSLIAAVGSFHAGCSQHEHMGGVCMCATGIKQSYVYHTSSFFWYLHEHRHVHSLKIRQCTTHSVDNSTQRERGYIEDCSWKEVNFCIVLQVLHNLKSVMTSKTMDGPKTWLGGTKTNKTKTWKNKMSVETNRMCSLSLLCMWSLI